VPDDAELVQMALRDRPDLVQLRFQRDAAGRFARAEKDLNYPTVSAVGSAGILPVHDPAMRDNYAAAGVNVSIPIFEGMLFSARRNEAELRAKATDETLRDAENNVIREVRIAVLNLSYAAEQMTLTAELLASANEAFDLAQARLNAGLSSIVEMSQAELNQTEAQIAQAKAKYEFQTRKSILNFQLGQTP
jgi:outer membrane protein